MRTIETISELEKIKTGCVLTIGNFDGVHLGHQEILAAAKQTSAQKAAELIVMTFEPHPVAILHPEKAPGVLTPLELKEHLLAELGIDCLVVLKDSAELLDLSPEDFVDRFLMKTIQPEVVIEGENFNFGYRRAGSIDTLQKLGVERGFEVCVIDSKGIKLSTSRIVKVSSTMIRNALEAGDIVDAAAALSRPYRLIGKVVPGCGKGKQLGFATANIDPAQQIIPAEGVYAGFVEIGDSIEQVCKTHKKIPAAISIGRSETLGSGNPLTIEAHLLIENVGDLSGKWLAMDFVKRIRSQIKFDSEKDLAEQMAKDCEKVKQILQNV